MFLLRQITFWRIVILAFVWFFYLQPLLYGSYNRLLAFYWWMRP